MRKYLYSIFALFMCIATYAQNTTVEYNRMIVCDNEGNLKGFNIENVSHIEFVNVEGPVKVDLTLGKVENDKLVVSMKRSEACKSFQIACEPTNIVEETSDIASLLEPQRYYVDLEDTTINVSPNVDYTLVVQAYDEYDIPCEVTKLQFQTPDMQLVEVESIEATPSELKLKFTPNADVSSFYVLLGLEGTTEQQYNDFAPTDGFNNIEDMIKHIGVKFVQESEYNWTQLASGKRYEMYILALDADGTYAPLQIKYFDIPKKGGEGIAEVEITLGNYRLSDWGGQTLYSQFVTYTPNDQASSYRFGVYLATEYDPVAEEIKKNLCSDPPTENTFGWFFEEKITTDYQINPNTEFVVIAAAKNVNDEWGPVTEVRSTTPGELPANSAPAIRGVRSRASE